MNRAQFEHAIRAAAAVVGEREVIVIGSQAIHAWIEDDIPEAAMRSMQRSVNQPIPEPSCRPRLRCMRGMPTLHALCRRLNTRSDGCRLRLDRELRRKAHEEHRSLNEVALRALERGLGMAEEAPRHHDLDDLAGTWVDDPEFDRAIEAMDQVDPELWR